MQRLTPTGSATSLLAPFALLCASQCASAMEGSFNGVDASLSGYGTVGGTFTSNGQYSYVHNANEFTGASNSFDVGLDSRIGVQVTLTFAQQWSVTAQEEAKLRGSTTLDPGTEWLFLQYQPYSDLKLRVGRVVLPSFFYSDVADVGYAVPWFHAPNEVYDGNGFNNIDGLQAQWQHALGPFQLGLEFTYGDGQATFNVEGGQFVAKAKNTVNGAISLTWRNLQLRYAQTDLRAGFNLTLGPSFSLNTTLKDYFHCYGIQYDNGKAILLSEFVKRNEDDLAPFNQPIGVAAVWYVAAGWRIGKFTPLVTYASFDLQQSLLTGPTSNHTWGASLRYDVVHDLDLKLQINRAQADNGTYWSLPQPTQQYINVYGFGADFVF